MRNLAEVLGVSGFVRWLGLRDDMPSLLDGADAFVLSSAWEGMPLVVGEAMAMEKPVVATDVGGVRELVGDAGVVIPPSPHTGIFTAFAASYTIRTAIGLIAGPESPPNPAPIRGRRVSASIGISLLPAQANTANQLLHNADVAMYHAKRQGKANYQFYDSGLEDQINVKDRTFA